jgi:leucyl aminopeptidase
MEKVVIKQNKKQLTSREIDTWEHVILVLPPTDWPQIPYQAILSRRARKLGDNGDPLHTELPNDRDTRVSWAAVKPGISSFDLLTLARKLVALHWDAAPTRIALAVPGLEADLAARVMEALVAAVLVKAAALPHYKSKKNKSERPLKGITLYGQTRKLDLNRTLAEAEGNHLARSLTVLPPNELTPARYGERIVALAKEQGWRMEFFDIKALRRMKAGAFLAVAQGGAAQDDGIVHLRYTPRAKSNKPALPWWARASVSIPAATTSNPPNT